MKKTVFTLFFLASAIGISAKDFTVDGINYDRLADSTSVAVAPSGRTYNGTITIPGKVYHDGKEYTVTTIGDSAFIRCGKLVSVTIPETITDIKFGAFAFDSCMTSITIPNSVKSIGRSAFYNCTSLTSLSIPNSVTEIVLCAFA